MDEPASNLSSYLGGSNPTTDPPTPAPQDSTPPVPPAPSTATPQDPTTPKVEVLTREEMESPPPSPPEENHPEKKRFGFLGKKFALFAILFLVLINIPVGWYLYQNFFAADEVDLAAQPPAPTTPIYQPEPTQIPPTLPSFPTDEPLAQGGLIETHSECFDGACIEIEGTGADECLVDADCLTLDATPSASPTGELAQLPVTGDEASPTASAASPTATLSPTSAPQTSPTAIPVPDTPAAGRLTDTLLTILSGLSLLALALLL